MYTSAQLLVIARDYRQRAESAGTPAQGGVWRALAREFERDAARLAQDEAYEAALAHLAVCRPAAEVAKAA